ncbi:MAG: universal stress protein [Cyclobacteriaceae bacterium]|nr:universal stress protein [Cyclobacteriaceae bacterium]
MMKRILVPTDFSTCANAAAEMAMRLAKLSGAEIYFLHLAVGDFSPFPVPGKSGSLDDNQAAIEKDNLAQMVEAAEADGIRAKYELVLGNGKEQIQDYIQPLQIDFLVMGSHGATGIRELVIGSKTQNVIRNIKIPCLVVKGMPRASELKHIVFASDFRKDCSSSFEVVIAFARVWHSRIHLLFVNLLNHLVDENAARLMMSNQMENFSNIDYTLNMIETNDKEFGIAQFAKEIDADMIAVSMETRTLLSRLFNPSVAEQLINRSAIPVLIIKQ